MRDLAMEADWPSGRHPVRHQTGGIGASPEDVRTANESLSAPEPSLA
jgi:Ni,Fe-hydrogenase III component G